MFSQRTQKIILVVIIILLILIGFIQHKRGQRGSVSLKDYKKQLALTDSLYKDSKGVYNRLVEDFKKTRQLNKELKSENEDLYKSVKESKGKTVITQYIELEPVTIIDTIIIEGETLRDTIKHFEAFKAFYPNKKDKFITYSLDKKDNLLLGTWSFDTLTIDLAIVEQERGIFRVKTGVPDWMNVRRLDVQSLPMSPLRKNNFDFVLGAGIGKNYNAMNNSVLFKGEAGFRLFNSIFMAEGNNSGDIYISYKRLF